MQHILYVCDGIHEDGGWSCQFCAGGLSACVTCGAFEGMWPDECPGRQMSAIQGDGVYEGELNYRAGEWRDECCQAMRPTYDRENYLKEHGYTLVDGRWVKEL